MVTNGRPRVLIVEDDPGIQHMLSLALRSAGYAAVEVDNGGQALNELGSQNFSAVVLDLGLPDERASEVLERLREITRICCGTPQWVVISALDESDAQGMFGPFESRYFSKPFDPWTLISRLEALLNAARSAPCSRVSHNRTA
jgi:two-component system KDP operon response regulator KdpE